MTADDAEALWAWVHTSTGEDDLGAWKRLLTQLEFRDPRRSLCAARVGELRRAALMYAGAVYWMSSSIRVLGRRTARMQATRSHRGLSYGTRRTECHVAAGPRT